MVNAWHPAAGRIGGLYERHASAWRAARGRSPFFERAWIDRFLSGVGAGEVLDLGCGDGQPIARHILEKGYAVTGVDGSASLIAAAREALPTGKWIQADMRTLDLGAQFGGILAWDSFFHLTPDDQRSMFAVFRRHAAADTALMFTSGPAFGEAIGTFEGEPLYHGSLAQEEYRALLAAQGFDVVDFVPEDATCGKHTIWLARQR